MVLLSISCHVRLCHECKCGHVLVSVQCASMESIVE